VAWHCSCAWGGEGSSIGPMDATAFSLERETSVKRHSIVIIALMMWLSAFGAASTAELSGAPFAHPGVAGAEDNASIPPFPAELFARTELFFGSLRSDKPPVSEQDFLGFLNNTITPLFPNGLTLLTGLGQFLNSQGVIQQEQSWLLILLYPVGERQDSNGKIEEIRDEYKKAFEQESVLRSDRCCEWVGF
jgi:Protein of unknown function (DUF3574)